MFILVVDEADALAQSRAAEQMHHEDRAGVDALLAGVDTLAGEAVPVLVIMCTNRERALDPAVLRRAAAIFHFSRPDESAAAAPSWPPPSTAPASTTEAIAELAALTGPDGDRPGFTYSDLTQRLIPAAILAAFPDKPLTADILLAAAAGIGADPRVPAGHVTSRCQLRARAGSASPGTAIQWLVAWHACVHRLHDAATGVEQPDRQRRRRSGRCRQPRRRGHPPPCGRRTATSRSNTPSTAAPRSTAST